MDDEGNLNLVHTTPKKKGQVEAQHQLVVSEQELPYRIIPYNGLEIVGGYSLSTDVGSLEEVATHYSCASMEGQWTKETSGGPIGSKTFSKNEHFSFTLDSDTDVLIILSREAKSGFKGKIGFYVAPMDERTSKVDEKKVILTKGFSSSRELVEKCHMKAGQYVIVPATHEIGHLIKYFVFLYSAIPIVINKALLSVKNSISISKSHEVVSKSADSTTRSMRGKRTKSVSVKTSTSISPVHSAVKSQLKSVETNVKSLQERLASLEQEKLSWPKERNGFLELMTKLRASQKEIEEETEESKRRDQESRARIESLAIQLEDVKTRKAKRGEELLAEVNKLKEKLAHYKRIEQEEQSNLKWNEPISFEEKTGKTIDVISEWKGESAGGSLNHLTWCNNPQIFLHVTKNSSVTLSLFQPKVEGTDNEGALSTSFYVFKTHAPYRRRLIGAYKEQDITCEGYFSTLKHSKFSKTTDLAASPNPYIIIPATFLPREESQFIFKVTSNNDVTVKLADDKDDWPIVRGKWDIGCAGGCTNFETFIENPSYSFKVEKRMRVKFLVSQNFVDVDDFDTMTVYVISSPTTNVTQKLLEYQPKYLVKHGQFTSRTEGFVETDLDPGSYVIIPCTFNPSKYSHFELRAICYDSSISIPALVPLANVRFLSYKGSWDSRTAGGSLNDEISWKKNTQFLLTLQKEMELIVLLSQPVKDGAKPFGIGWSVSKGATKISCPDPIHQSAYRPNKKLQETVTLPAGSYIFVPTTFNAGETTDFEVKITAQDPDFATLVSFAVLL
eukprot:TRINITY_DN10273_c0_g1_i1.p1 TRINITY_DN10273_c0_g1~~TRINITY_DN10273_c0_g1_i1.p1  ORF type:complete len:869 (+),score=163.90 TRINITY_DN10273_c0_g1_i1:250-2607(+)